jgi:outer membrane murein-binding lipoprotein Lpp
MRLVVGLPAMAMLLLAGCSSMPGGQKAADHAAHHSAATQAPDAAPAGYDRQMSRMHEMHQKMAAATTPEERSTLMKDHAKTMHDGMAMMGQMRGMRGGGMGGRGPAASRAPGDADLMQRRMDMMDMMMQMMMDREGTKPPATR